MTELEFWALEFPDLDIEEIEEVLLLLDECDASQTVTSDDP